MPSKDLVIGIDSGTTACKVVIVDTIGNVAASGRASLPMLKPRPSWHEQAADSWWEAAAAQIPPGAAGLTLVPYWNSAMNPYWDAGGGKKAGGRRVDMGGNLIKRWLLAVALAIFALGVASSQNKPEAARQNPELDSPRLSPDDRAELIEVLRLKAALGDQVWPGLGRAEIPIILYDERNEFLIGAASPPAPWTAVERDDFGGKPYFRRNSSKPEAFAVRVGEVWAGSVTTLEMMIRKNPIKVGLELHLMFVHHEMFHAYEAGQAPERFRQAMKVYADEDRYPFKDAEFAAAWNKEGSLLAAALKASDDKSVRSTVREFLQTRDARRAKVSLSPDLLAFERELEWLEGLAKYVEIRFYELAAARADEPAYSRYRPAMPYWLQAEFFRLGSQLSRQDGDLRFYSSGMAQARLLDRLSPGWKDNVMLGGAYLEDLLRSVLVDH